MGKLKVNRGTTYTIGIIYKRDGVLASLVGATVRFTVKPKEFDEDMDDSDATLIKNVTNGTAQGEATITLDPDDTKEIIPKKYFYDVKVEQADGEIYKIDEGIFILDGSPTNRTT